MGEPKTVSPGIKTCFNCKGKLATSSWTYCDRQVCDKDRVKKRREKRNLWINQMTTGAKGV